MAFEYSQRNIFNWKRHDKDRKYTLFYKQRQAKIGKKSGKQQLSNTLRLNFRYLKIICFLYPRYNSEILGDILKKSTKTKYVCLNEVIWLMIMKIRLKMKNRLHRYDINIPRFRHVHKYTKYKMCLSMIMVICIKQHLSNIWSSIHEKVKQHWGCVEKKALLKSSYRTYQT